MALFDDIETITDFFDHFLDFCHRFFYRADGVRIDDLISHTYQRFSLFGGAMSTIVDMVWHTPAASMS